MTEQKPDAKAADAKPAKKAYDGPLDFTELADAQRVADDNGGTVEHVGVAFHVNLDSND